MKLKKILALVLAVAMVLSTMSFSVFAEGESATEVAEDYVAAIGEQGYETLQAAIDAVQNENTIVLLKESDEDVIVVQTPDIAFTIDGNDNTMFGTITIDGKSAAYATAGLTIENVNFDATSITKDASINFGGTNDTRYISNVTVKNCTFTGEENAKVGIKSYTGGDKNLTITDCKALGLHSLAQLKNVAGVTVSECNIEGKSGISLGASHDAVVSNCVMNLTNYGVRADAIEEGAGVEISDCEISAFIPVVVRNVSENYVLAFSGTNTMTASNTDDIWCAVGASEYEKNGELPTAPETGEVTVTLDDNGLSVEGIYGAASADEEELSVMEIYDWEDLKELDAIVEGGNMLEGVTVRLMNDIDLYEMGTDGEPVTFNPIGANTSYFKGTFDGQGHTIKNMYQSGWVLGYDWDNYGTIGLFAYLWNATVKNLTIEDAECFVEGGNVASIAGCAWGDCTFENITVKNSTFATYNNRAAGIVGYTGGEGTMTFKDITVDEDTVIAGLWGSFDSSLGGVIASIQDPTKIVIENSTVKCRLDCYNDVTASYKYYAYRMCGMLIGKMPVDGDNKPILDNVTITNVDVEFNNWAN
ncbi:MAG: right-handed parallel beta-helix repeat-containing protein, partial [Clostridia bacterium]|nr:right-handed parallel beta-helix repeat-containing protein [Clostridia bacterium]